MRQVSISRAEFFCKMFFSEGKEEIVASEWDKIKESYAVLNYGGVEIVYNQRKKISGKQGGYEDGSKELSLERDKKLETKFKVKIMRGNKVKRDKRWEGQICFEWSIV